MMTVEVPEDLLPGDKLRRNFDDADGYTLVNFFVDGAGRAWWNVSAPYGPTTLPDWQIRGSFHKDQGPTGALAVEGVAEVLHSIRIPAAVGLLGIVHEIDAAVVTVRFGDQVLTFAPSSLRPRPDADPAEVEASYL